MSYSTYNYDQAPRTIVTNLTKNYGKNPTIPAVHGTLASSVTITPLASYGQHLSTSNPHKFSSGFQNKVELRQIPSIINHTILQYKHHPRCMMVCACNLSTWAAVAGVSGRQP